MAANDVFIGRGEMASLMRRKDWSQKAAVGNGLLEAGMEVITKPFTVAALGNKVWEMLDRGTSDGEVGEAYSAASLTEPSNSIGVSP